MNRECPSAEELKLLAVGRLSDPPSGEVEAHVLDCLHCQQATASLNVADTFVDAVRQGARGTPQVSPADQGRVDQMISDLSGLHGSPALAQTQSGAVAANVAGDAAGGHEADELIAELTRTWQPAQQADELGRLGGYRLLRLLGAGGMGGVFLAEDTQLQRRVALKVMRPELARRAGTAERFLREARAAATLRHDHVITIYHVGQEAGTPFLTMEYLEGESLDERLRRESRLPVSEVVRIGRELAEGLAAAHDKGLVHRDIKPANIWLEAGRDRVKILDFGVARSVEQDSQLTARGVIVGTPAYMSPEQASGGELDGRADLFSLGCVLYRMATGRTPFPGRGAVEIFTSLATVTPAAPRSLNSDVPAELSDLILRLLAKDRANRPASGHEVADRLQALPQPVTLPTAMRPRPDVSWWRGPKTRIAAGCGAFLFLCCVIIITITNKDGTQTKIEVPDTSKVAIIASENSKSQISNLKSQIPNGTGWHGWPADAPAPAIAPFNAAQAKKHQSAWATYIKVPVEYTNTIGMKFALIPPGEFTMGSGTEEIQEALRASGDNKFFQACIKSEGLQHRVILTKPIYLGIHEVRQQDYTAIMGNNPSNFAATGEFKEFVAGLDTSNHPVEFVSWNDAAEFCEKLSQRQKLEPFYSRAGETVKRLQGNGYRLPTEAEWEFACRAGTTTKYWTGQDDEDLRRAGWFSANSGGVAHATGELKANPFGCHDIHGNVWEWVHDGWEPDEYEQHQDNPAINPNGPSSVGLPRIIRGGIWNLEASRCRASHRFAYEPTYRDRQGIGFRVALTVDAVRQMSKVAKDVPTALESPPVQSALDALDPARIPQLQRFDWQPKELVAVLGDHAWRHWGPVHSVTINPEGTLIASAGQYDGVRLWEAATGKQLATWPGKCVAFTPDGSGLAIGGAEMTIIDVATRETRTSFKNVIQSVVIAFSSDGNFVATWAADAIRVSNVGTGKDVLNLKPESFKNDLRAIALSTDGKKLAAACGDGVQLWDVATAEKLPPLNAKNPGCLAFSPDGTLLAAGGDELKLWTLKDHSERTILTGHEGQPGSLAFSRDGKTLASGHAYGAGARLWDVMTGQRKAVFENHRSSTVTAIGFMADGQTLVSGGGDAAVRVWNANTAQQINLIPGYLNQVDLLALTPDARTLAVATVGYGLGRVAVWDVLAGRERVAWEADGELIGLDIGKNGTTLATAGREGVQLWDLATGEKQPPLSDNPTAVAVKFGPDGTTVSAISLPKDTEIRSWQLSTGKMTSSFRVGEVNTYTRWLDLSSDGATFAYCDRNLHLWNAATRTIRFATSQTEGGFLSPVFARDGKKLLVIRNGDGQEAPTVYDTTTGQLLAAYRDGHQGEGPFYAIFLRDDKTILSAGHDGRIIEWTSPRQKRVLCRLPGPVLNLALAADGRHLFTANSNGTVYVLRLSERLQAP